MCYEYHDCRNFLAVMYLLKKLTTYTAVYSKANKKILAKIVNPKLAQKNFTLLDSALHSTKLSMNIVYVHLGNFTSPEFVS